MTVEATIGNHIGDQKSHQWLKLKLVGNLAKIKFYNSSTTESTTMYVVTQLTYNISVLRLKNNRDNRSTISYNSKQLKFSTMYNYTFTTTDCYSAPLFKARRIKLRNHCERWHQPIDI